MRETFNPKIIQKTLALLGLGLLLVLSPCKVRHFIQNELGLPQTEISNKNKTTFSKSCDDLDVSIELISKEKQANPSFLFVFKPFQFVLLAPNFQEQFPTLGNTFFSRVSPVPFYILYQNFKDYL